MRTARSARALVALGTAFALTTCAVALTACSAELPLTGPTQSTTAGAGVGAGPAPATTAAAVRAAAADLASIPVRPIPGRDPSYRREAFGDAWSDVGVGIAAARNGCDTRNDILRRDAKPGTVKFKAGTHNCKVTAGSWVSPYTGATITSRTLVDIDHIVPLSRAWSAGAKSWSAQTKLNFANDPDNLVAADRKSNRAKGDLGPSAWRPTKPYQCAYAVRYIRATKKYTLPLSPSDVSALRGMLATCPAK
jgi:hypothetical protein